MTRFNLMIDWLTCIDGFTCRSFSKWNYHWSLVSNGDFSELNKSKDDEKNTPKIKFKIVPPPPKPKPKAPPPPPPKKAPSPKLLRLRRRVELDVFRLCWKESWMSLKPPKYLYLKAKELKPRIPGFTTIELTKNRKYKPEAYNSEAERTCPINEWRHSWEQVKLISNMVIDLHQIQDLVRLVLKVYKSLSHIIK